MTAERIPQVAAPRVAWATPAEHIDEGARVRARVVRPLPPVKEPPGADMVRRALLDAAQAGEGAIRVGEIYVRVGAYDAGWKRRICYAVQWLEVQGEVRSGYNDGPRRLRDAWWWHVSNTDPKRAFKETR